MNTQRRCIGRTPAQRFGYSAEMPLSLQPGFSYGVVQENIAILHNHGLDLPVAVATSMSHARADYFAKHPAAALPEWLAYPRNRRLAVHYEADGKPAKDAAHRTKSAFAENPAPSAANLARAQKLYRDFTGAQGTEVVKMELPKNPREGLVFGELLVIGYRSMRDGKPYAHEFRKSSRPLLVASHDGKQIVIVGGRYIFTDRGIEDK